jgi:cell wall-associated NlpC family hydrolase
MSLQGLPPSFATVCLCLAAWAPAVRADTPAAPPASPQTPTATLVGAWAIAPPSAPPAVKAMIRAANHIRHRPYVWGGGHRKWRSRGYDCSGSVSYVLHAGGLLDYPLDSTGFMRYGEGGGDQWVQIYANRKHAFMIIAGLRWDTAGITDGDRSGPGWSTVLPTSTKGYRERQPLDVERAVPLWHP